MRIIREVEIPANAAFDTTYDVKAMGARGFLLACSRDGGTGMEITGLPITGANGTILLKYLPTGGGATDEHIDCGFPIPYQSLRVNFMGAAVREARIAFVDEPITPYGKLSLTRWVLARAAGTSLNFLTTWPCGIVREIQFTTVGDRAHHYTVTLSNHALTYDLTGQFAIAGVTGGSNISPRMPAPRTIGLTIFNDDGVNVLNYSGEITGYL